MLMSQKTIEFSVEKGVATIRLCRPEIANTVSPASATDLLEATTACRANPEVRAVLLTGSGKFFSAGGDLKYFSTEGDELKLRKLVTDFHAALLHLATLKVPVVVAVNGIAAGGGMSLALTGDLVYAARSATFTAAYTAAGLSPDGSMTVLLSKLVGLRRAQELLLTNRRLSAEEALDWGLITGVVEADALAEHAEAVATRLANGPTQAYGRVRDLLRSSFSNTMEAQLDKELEGIVESLISVDGREGLRAFLGKRKPTFTGQ
jgi:2-(1,2-epoxy-1,2-dihydrophenyl)acetyl-CoA isomerase